MPIPPEFREQDHLQDVIRKWINREVRDYFIDLGGDEWDPDLREPRANLRYACQHKDRDSLLMTSLRWQLFERIRRSAFDQPYYGIPVGSHHQTRKFKPQVTLYFQEDIGDVEPSFSPVTGQITFRLMTYEGGNLNPAIAQTLANRIETNFGVGGGYLWRKGRLMATYTDNERGYKLQIYARTEGDARDLIDRVLDIQTHTPNWENLNISENQNAAAAYPTLPPNDVIYGSSRRLPRKRPVASVRFQASYLNIWGLTNPVTLYDRTGLYPSALVS
ncbi:MAG: hypothetical protein AAF609_12605 [Cyanobacteria bacterium P01_C01_bin.120]